MTVALEGVRAPPQKKIQTGGRQMEKVSITITTDKPVKIRVAPAEETAANQKEAEGAKRLIRDVKEAGNVVSKRETRSGDKR
jgi:hypothetical protein